MRALAAALLLAGAAAAQDRAVVQLLDAHARAVGDAARVKTLAATLDITDQLGQRANRVQGATAHWELPGRFRRDIPLGKDRVLTEYRIPGGVFQKQGPLFERYRPGQRTTRARYYYLAALADPFPLLRYANDPAEQRTLQLGSTELKGVRHPVIYTLPDAYGVRTIYILDPATHLLRNVRFEQRANDPFTSVTYDDFRKVGEITLPYVVSAYLYPCFEDPKSKRVRRSPVASQRVEQVVSWKVGADVGDVDFDPPAASTAVAPGFRREVVRTGADPLDAGIADLDGDRKPDIAVACWGGLYVHFGGALDQPVFVPLGKGHHAGVAFDDIDCDGRLDVVTTSNVEPAQMYFIVSFDGERRPEVKQQYGAPLFARQVTVTDLDDDGIPDFVATGHGSSDLQIQFGNGCGGVRPLGQRWPLDPKNEGARGWGVAVGDIDGDPMRDIAVVDGAALSVFQGAANLSFHRRAQPLPLRRPIWIAMADLDGDRRDDLLTVNDDLRQPGMAQDLAVIHNRDGKLKVAANLAVGERLQAVATGDLDGNGKVDAVTAAMLDGEIAVLLGDGEGGFAAPEKHGSGRGTSRVAVGDVDGDGRDDIVAVNRLDDTLSIFVNTRAFPPRPRHRPRRAEDCGPPTRVDFKLTGLSDEYEFAGEFVLPTWLRDPSGITVLGGNDVHAQLLLVSDKKPAFYRATLDRKGARLLVGPAVPLEGPQREELDLEGAAYDFQSGNVFLACESDSSILRTTIFGQVLGREPTGVEVDDNDGIEGLALRRKKDGTPLLYVLKERLGTTLKQPYVRVLEATEDPFALKRRGEDLRLPVLLADQTGAACDHDRLLVVSRFHRGIVEVRFQDDGFAPDPHKAVLSPLTDNVLGLDNPKGRLFGVIEGIALGPYGDLYLVADNNGGEMGKRDLGNRARAGRLLWFRRIGARPEQRVPGHVVFRQILVPFKGAPGAPADVAWTREEAHERALRLLDRARAGEAFEALHDECAAFSKTEPLVRVAYDGHKRQPGEYKRADLPAALGRLAFNLEPGEVGLVEWQEQEAPRGYRVVLRVE